MNEICPKCNGTGVLKRFYTFHEITKCSGWDSVKKECIHGHSTLWAEDYTKKPTLICTGFPGKVGPGPKEIHYTAPCLQDN